MTPSDDLPEDEFDETSPLPTEMETVNGSDPEAVRDQKRTQTRAKRQVAEFYRKVFADPAGRKAMWDILDALHPFDIRLAVGPTGFPDPMGSFIHLAEQQAGNRLYTSWLQLDPAGVLLMQQEHDPRFPKKTRKRAKRDPDGE